jgi:hypothetical protein
MDGLYHEILISISGLAATGAGVGIKYMLNKLQEIVPRMEIQDMISSQLEKAEAKDESIMNRLTRMEHQLDALVDHLLKDGARNGPER